MTQALSALPDLDHVLSIANVADFQVDPMGGVIAGMLVDGVPLVGRSAGGVAGQGPEP